jgi:PAS domain S-box-containing protein
MGEEETLQARIDILEAHILQLSGRLDHERSEYQKIESILERGKREWEATFDAVTDMIILTDTEGRVVRCNQSTVGYLNRPYSQILGTAISMLFFGSSEVDPQIFESVSHEVQFPGMQGWFDINTYPLFVQDVRSGSVHVIKDITERQQSQETLRNNQEELRRINDELENRVRQRTLELIQTNQDLQHEVGEREKIQGMLAKERDLLAITLLSIRDSVISTDKNGMITLFNKAAETATGITKEEALGKLFNDVIQIIDEKTNQVCPDPLSLLLARQADQGLSAYLTLLSRSGDRLLISCSSAPVKDEENALVGYVMVIDDITEQTRIEAQLVLSQKMESVGRLAAGIAHEINTPMQYVGDNTHFLNDAFQSILQVFQGHEEVMQHMGQNSPEQMRQDMENLRQMRLSADLEFYLSEIPSAVQQSLEGIDRVRKIVMAMKAFSHPTNKEKKPNDINQGIDTTITISRSEWKYQADMEVDLEPNLPLVSCDIDEINQVFLNMIVNSAQAIQELAQRGGPKKGVIRITTRSRDGEVVITLSDTGAGISQANLNRIFDPFFTTKKMGMGTGQGLSLAHNIIVNQHKGKISVESELDKGTTFTIVLPTVDPNVSVGEDAVEEGEAME